ncbi:MAG: DNA polymerase III subunit gamma/tau [Candidatus Absconditabacteria bacterium]
MSLTLKYRPKTFEDVLNQEHITDILKAQVKNGNTVQNYLFFGPRGTGKTTTARLIAKAINCLEPEDGSPCNKCVNCEQIKEGKTMDLVEIDAASHTQVDNIRDEILDKAVYPPSSLKKKVYIIDEVHMLSKQSFNALLKIMEEPPAYLVFILATTEMGKVPDTVASRSLIFNFKKFSNTNLVARLAHICKTENLTYTEGALDMIAKVSDGAMRDGIKYLEQVSIIGEINEDNVTRFLGVAPERIINQLIDLMRAQDFNAIIEYVENTKNNGIDLYTFAKQILTYIDDKFMEDVSFYAKLADLFRNIIVSIKNYPLPIVIYKSEIYKYIKGNNENFVPTITVEKKTISQKKQSPKVEVFKEEKIIEKDSSIEPKVQDLEEKNEIIKEKDGNNIGNKEIKYEEINKDETMKAIVKVLGDSLLGKSMEKYASIDIISKGFVRLIVINEMQSKKMQSELSKIEEVFSSQIGESVKIEIKYMSSNDFMKNSLFG